MLRPCVPAIRSCSRGWTMMSSMRTVGMPCMKRLPLLAGVERHVDRVLRAEEQQVPVARMSVVITLTLPIGRLAAIDVHVSPKSFVTNTYGL